MNTQNSHKILEDVFEICKKSDDEVIRWFKNHEQRNNQMLHNELLIAASFKGRTEVVEYLIGIANTIPTYIGCTTAAICYSIQNGHKDILDLFLKYGIFRKGPQPNLQKSVNMAGEKGHIDVLKLLINDGRIDLFGSEMENPLLGATCYNHVDIVDLFIKDRKIIDGKYNYPYDAYLKSLNFACRDGKKTISCMLLDNVEFEYQHLIDAHKMAKDTMENYNFSDEVNDRYTTIMNKISELINNKN